MSRLSPQDLNERRIRLFKRIHPHHRRLVQLMLPQFLLSLTNVRLNSVTLFRFYLLLVHLILILFVISTILLHKELISENLSIKFSQLTLRQKNLLVDEFLQAKVNGTTYTSCNICHLARQLRNFTVECASDRIDLTQNLKECKDENTNLRQMFKLDYFVHFKSECEKFIRQRDESSQGKSSRSIKNALDAHKDTLTSREFEFKLLKEFVLNYEKEFEKKTQIFEKNHTLELD